MRFMASRQFAVLRWTLHVEGGLGLLALVLGFALGLPTLNAIRWTNEGLAAGLAATAPLLVFFFVGMHAPGRLLGDVRRDLERMLRPLMSHCGLLDLALIAALAGLGEELLFRAVVQGEAERWLGPWGGLAFASLVFGVAHSLSWAYVLTATVIGAYLGLLWRVTDNLLAPVVAHAVYDLAALVYFLRFVPPPAKPTPTGLDTDEEPDVPAAASESHGVDLSLSRALDEPTA